MKDKGLNSALVQNFNTSKFGENRAFFGFRKMFRDYLTKLNVPWYDTCCIEATPDGIYPMRFNNSSGIVEFFNGTDWADTTVPMDESSPTFSTVTALITKTAFLQSTGSFIQVVSPEVFTATPTALNTTATITSTQLTGGLLTSTSAAPVTLTLPLGTDLATATNAVRGTNFEFIVDNSAGASIVTIAVNTGITAITPVITGGATLTVAAGTLGVFKIIFVTLTTAKIARIV